MPGPDLADLGASSQMFELLRGHRNPCEVGVGTPARLPLDFGVLLVAAALMITGASALLPRLMRG